MDLVVPDSDLRYLVMRGGGRVRVVADSYSFIVIITEITSTLALSRIIKWLKEAKSEPLHHELKRKRPNSSVKNDRKK